MYWQYSPEYPVNIYYGLLCLISLQTLYEYASQVLYMRLYISVSVGTNLVHNITISLMLIYCNAAFHYDHLALEDEDGSYRHV